MRLAWAAVALASAVGSAAAVPGRSLPASAAGPPPGHTGGFGEPTCTACHADHPPDAGGGRIAVTGFPGRYTPGATYRLTVVVQRDGARRGGFQLAVRGADGAQAGALAAADGRAGVVHSSSGVQYAQHVGRGTAPTAGDSLSWVVEWRAPERGAPVVLHTAGNAANDDDSEFGDFIYTEELTSRPTRPGE